MEQQTDEWLASVSLKPGLVVCDNGRNLVAALGLAGLTHIPCLAHVLNLVVQRFLKTYPDMPQLLQKVRAVCAHFRRSHPAAARLSALQRNFGLPAHRLICDVPTRWNSTLHMLARLCEQQQAIVGFQLQHAHVSRSVEQNHFTTNTVTGPPCETCVPCCAVSSIPPTWPVPMMPFSALLSQFYASLKKGFGR